MLRRTRKRFGGELALESIRDRRLAISLAVASITGSAGGESAIALSQQLGD